MSTDAVNFTRALLGQGLLQGWGDEAEAWLRSKIGEKTYEDELANITRDYGEYATRSPVPALTAEFARSVMPVANAAAQVSNAATNDPVNATRALLGQGLLMGWGDEAEALLRSKMGKKTYEDELANINQDYGKYASENPSQALTTEFLGGVLPMAASYVATPVTGGAAAPAAVATTARTLNILARLAENPVARAAVTGAVTGGITGAGSAQPGERGENALRYAGLGTVLGGLTPAVVRGAKSGYDWLRERLLPSEDVIMQGATSRINRAFSQANEGQGMSPQEAAAALAADRARGIPSTLANADPALVRLAEVAAQRSGASANIIEGAIGRQTAGARDRVFNRAKSELSGGNYYDEENQMVNDLRSKASTLYDDAYKFGSVEDKRIMTVLGNPKFKEFYDKARQIAATEKMAAKLRGEDTSKYDLEELYRFDKKGNLVLTKVPDVRTLDYIKRGMDATIDSGFRGQGMSTAEANALKDLRRQFVNVLDEATVDPQTGVSAYQNARKVYAGDMEVLDAMRTGRNDFNRLDHEEIAKMFATMSDAERDAFRTGAVRNIYDRVMVPSKNINAAQTLIESPEYSAKLQELFDSPAQFDLFKAALLRESQLHKQAARILGGSPTARRTAEQKAFDQGSPVGNVVADTVTSGFDISMVNLVARLARNATMTDDIAKEVSRLLMSSDPTEVAAAVKLLEDYGARSVKTPQKLNATEAGIISGTMAALPPPPVTAETPNIEADIEQKNKAVNTQGGPDIEADLRALKAKRDQSQTTSTQPAN